MERVHEATIHPPVSVVVYATRERARAIARAAFPRRRSRLVLTRTSAEFAAVFRGSLVDAALVDVGSLTEETWKAAELAREYPSVPFFALSPVRPGDAPALARCASLDFTDIITESVDDAVVRDIVLPLSFSARFAAALRQAPPTLDISTPVREAAWRYLIAHAGRAVRTDTLAAALHLSREHLSRSFAAAGAANLKRVIDLVRLISAAELAKNPGYDVGDVARVLGFASSSHLATTAQRIVGMRPSSLSRLRAIDLVERFTHGRGRSRE